jgi:hypothetical protein
VASVVVVVGAAKDMAEDVVVEKLGAGAWLRSTRTCQYVYKMQFWDDLLVATSIADIWTFYELVPLLSAYKGI